MAAQPNISDDYFKSKRPAFLNALKYKTGLILAKAAAIIANLEPACLASPLPRVLLRVAKSLCILLLLIMNFAPPAAELNLLREWLVLQGSCIFLALLMVNLGLYSIRLGRRFMCQDTGHPTPPSCLLPFKRLARTSQWHLFHFHTPPMLTQNAFSSLPAAPTTQPVPILPLQAATPPYPPVSTCAPPSFYPPPPLPLPPTSSGASD